MKRPSARRATPFFKKYSSAIVLTSVITVGVIAAAVAQYQRIYQGPLAPTAPQSQPAAAENPVCSIVFEITATPTSTPTPTPTSTPTPTPSSTPTPSPTPSSTPTPTPSNSPTPTPTSTPTPTPSSTPTPSPTPSSTPTPTPSNTPSPTPSATPTPGCNTDCETNADCRANHICYTVSSTSKVCRLAAHPTSIVCAPATPTPTPTSTPTPTPTPTASPIALGCNDNCTRNADCRDSNHICFDTGNNTYKCRLATNPSSDRCEQTVAQATSTPAPALPQAGGTSSTTMSIVIVSAAVVIIGAIGLLLLL